MRRFIAPAILMGLFYSGLVYSQTDPVPTTDQQVNSTADRDDNSEWGWLGLLGLIGLLGLRRRDRTDVSTRADVSSRADASRRHEA
jgi:MYXO-CTERM domain-containing protein